MTLALNLLAYVVLSTSGLLLLRAGLREDGGLVLLRDPRMLIGAALYAVSFLAWLFALRRRELSHVYPIFIGSGYVAIVLASALFLDESLGAARLAGIAFVGIGLLLLVA